ncbi:MAG: lipase family protein [Pseudomonadota bacterium]
MTDNSTWACRLLDAAILTYDILPMGNAVSEWAPNANTEGLLKNVGDLANPPDWFFSGDQSIDAGFVGRTSDNYAVLALRGTLPPGGQDTAAWIKDWLEDFEVGPEDWALPCDTVIGQIETGFASAAKKLWSVAEAPLAKIVDDPGNPPRGIVVCGHSKGAALVYPVASLVEATWPGRIARVDAYATPMTANQSFANWYSAAGLTAKTTRYQNRYDIVPFLPVWPKFDLTGWIMKILGLSGGGNLLSDDYVHIGDLVYLADQNGKCVEMRGQTAEDQADRDMQHALDNLDLDEIIDAHSATGRYHTCICGSVLPKSMA